MRTDRKLLAEVLRLAIPCIFENIMVSFVDTAIVGALGATATAAVAVNAAPTWLLNGLICCVSVGGTVVVAQAIGAGERARAEAAAHQAALLGFLFGLAFFAAAMLFGDKVPIWMGAEADVAPTAGIFLRNIGFGFLMNFFGLVLCGVMRGAGDMKTPMLIVMVSNIANAALNFLLVYPTREVALPAFMGGLRFIMPGAGMGVPGSGLATAIATSLVGVLAFAHMLRRKSVIQLKLSRLVRLDAAMAGEILRIGVPAAAERVAINLGQIMFQRLIATLGTVTLAAHSLTTTAEQLAYMPAYGFQAAATTLVGQAAGARDGERARRGGYATLLLALGFVMAGCVVLFAFPDRLLSIFTEDARVIAAGIPALRIAAMSQPFFACATVLTGALRGAGDTLTPMLVGLFSMWVVRLGTSLVFVKLLGWGLTGAWLGMMVDLVLRGTLMFLRFHRGGWRRAILVTY